MKKGNSSKGSKRVQGKGNKIEEKKMTDEKKQAIKKEVRKDVDEVLMKKLMGETINKFDTIAKDVVLKKCANTTNFKFGNKVVVAMGERKRSFVIWVKTFNKSGNRIASETFTIKTIGKETEMVIDGLVKKVKTSYEILLAAGRDAQIAKKPEAKKVVKKSAIKKEEVSPAV